LIIAVGRNNEKNAMFTVPERVDMLEAAINSERGDKNSGFGSARIEIVPYGGLLVDFAKERGAGVIIKGLRSTSDFEYEFQMAQANKYLNGCLETVFVMTSLQYAFLSSGAVREIAFHGGRLDGLAPRCVIDGIHDKLT
jgi:pantetheine-phosphate adenylyltransferase